MRHTPQLPLPGSAVNLLVVRVEVAMARAMEWAVFVDDPDMPYHITSDAAKHIASFIRRSWTSPDRSGYLLVFGSPGCGKTRLLRELFLLINEGPASVPHLFSHLTDQDEGARLLQENTANAVCVCVTLNSMTPLCAADIDGIQVTDDLLFPVAARILFIWFEHSFSTLSTFCTRLVRQLQGSSCNNMRDMINCRQLLAAIKDSTGKNKLILCIDETLTIEKILKLNEVKEGGRYVETVDHLRVSSFLSECAALQNQVSGEDNRGKTVVLFTGLRRSVFLRMNSVTNRSVYTVRLPIIKEELSEELFPASLVQPVVQRMQEEWSAKPEDAPDAVGVARTLLYLCAGLPRAAQIVRSELKSPSGQYSLSSLLTCLAEGYGHRYRLHLRPALLILALAGRKVLMQAPIAVEDPVDGDTQRVRQLETVVLSTLQACGAFEDEEATHALESLQRKLTMAASTTPKVVSTDSVIVVDMDVLFSEGDLMARLETSDSPWAIPTVMPLQVMRAITLQRSSLCDAFSRLGVWKSLDVMIEKARYLDPTGFESFAMHLSGAQWFRWRLRCSSRTIRMPRLRTSTARGLSRPLGQMRPSAS